MKERIFVTNSWGCGRPIHMDIN